VAYGCRVDAAETCLTLGAVANFKKRVWRVSLFTAENERIVYGHEKGKKRPSEPFDSFYSPDAPTAEACLD
jgi:hypothetical protein